MTPRSIGFRESAAPDKAPQLIITLDDKVLTLDLTPIQFADLLGYGWQIFMRLAGRAVIQAGKKR